MKTLRNNPGFLVDFPSMLNDVFGNENGNNFVNSLNKPAVNIQENDSEFGIELVAPGFKKEDFNIKIEEEKLTISAETEDKKNDSETNYSLREFKHRSFTRTFTLPENKINEDEIKANYVNGILLVSLPKKEEAKPKAPKKIEIL
jgi:HSP20 family protein